MLIQSRQKAQIMPIVPLIQGDSIQNQMVPEKKQIPQAKVQNGMSQYETWMIIAWGNTNTNTLFSRVMIYYRGIKIHNML